MTKLADKDSPEESLICPVCGSPYIKESGDSYICEGCGTIFAKKQYVAKIDELDERKINAAVSSSQKARLLSLIILPFIVVSLVLGIVNSVKISNTLISSTGSTITGSNDNTTADLGNRRSEESTELGSPVDDQNAIVQPLQNLNIMVMVVGALFMAVAIIQIVRYLMIPERYSLRATYYCVFAGIIFEFVLPKIITMWEEVILTIK